MTLLPTQYVKMNFHEDNVPAHTSTVSIAEVHELGSKLLPRPYFPDVAPSDFLLFPNFKI